MKHVGKLFIIPILFTALSSCAQQDTTAGAPQIQRFTYTLGVTKVAIRKTIFSGAGSYFLIQLHDDENTADSAATAFLQQYGGILLRIENNNTRYIQFRIGKKVFWFDPNRMFTTHGLRENLHLYGTYSPAAAKEVAGFANFLLKLVPDSIPVIAVHNNTDGRYSVSSYAQDKELRNDVAAVTIVPTKDSDDFFYTTDNSLYEQIVAEGYSCVLQKWEPVNDDGSLSIHYGRQKRTYVNVEAQAGHFFEQLAMLEVVRKVLDTKAQSSLY